MDALLFYYIRSGFTTTSVCLVVGVMFLVSLCLSSRNLTTASHAYILTQFIGITWKHASTFFFFKRNVMSLQFQPFQSAHVVRTYVTPLTPNTKGNNNSYLESKMIIVYRCKPNSCCMHISKCSVRCEIRRIAVNIPVSMRIKLQVNGVGVKICLKVRLHSMLMRDVRIHFFRQVHTSNTLLW